MLFISTGWFAVNIKGGPFGISRRLLLAACGIPGIILVIPMAHKVVWAFAAQSLVMVSALIALLLTLLVGTLGAEHVSRRWILPVSSLMLGLILLVFAIAISGPTEQHQRASELASLLR
jgi:hypothetical protein